MMDREDLVKELSAGKFATVIFTKKNGEERRLTGRTGVKKGVKGTGRNYDEKEKNIITMYDANIQQHRSIKADSIKEVHANGKVIRPKD